MMTRNNRYLSARLAIPAAALAAAALVATLGNQDASAQSPAQATAQATTTATAQTWDVQVGGGGEGPAGAPPVYEAQAYGPSPLVIHAGDTVRWNFAGVHTVTFNSGKPDLPLVLPGPNPGELTLGRGSSRRAYRRLPPAPPSVTTERNRSTPARSSRVRTSRPSA
jgi:plastocyanin